MGTESVRVLEGTWEEIAQQADNLAGRQLRVMVLPPAAPPEEMEARPFYETASPEAWKDAFFDWAHGHAPRRAPPLSDEAISRGSIYGERLDKQL